MTSECEPELSGKPRLYLSGPINSKVPDMTKQQCLANFESARNWIEEFAPHWEVVDPTILPNPNEAYMAASRPATEHRRSDYGTEGLAFLRQDIVEMMTCEAIALLPGWTHSRGAIIEQRISQDLGFGCYIMSRHSDGWRMF